MKQPLENCEEFVYLSDVFFDVLVRFKDRWEVPPRVKELCLLHPEAISRSASSTASAFSCWPRLSLSIRRVALATSY